MILLLLLLICCFLCNIAENIYKTVLFHFFQVITTMLEKRLCKRMIKSKNDTKYGNFNDYSNIEPFLVWICVQQNDLALMELEVVPAAAPVSSSRGQHGVMTALSETVSSSAAEGLHVVTAVPPCPATFNPEVVTTYCNTLSTSLQSLQPWGRENLL